MARYRHAFSIPTRDGNPLERLFPRCAELGFEALALRPEQYGIFLGNPAGFLGRWAGHVERVMALLVDAPLTTAMGRRQFETVLHLAAGIGCYRIILDCPDPPLARMIDPAVVLDALHVAAREARELRIRLSLRNRRDRLLDSRADLVRLARWADPEAVGLAIDTAHVVLAGEKDWAALLGDVREHVDCVHLTDIVRSRLPMLEGDWAKPCALGEGDVDFRAVFDALDRLGYEGWLIAEDPGEVDPVSAMKRAGQFLTSHDRV
jgi:sugar phosphate isomerase/epimerase